MTTRQIKRVYQSLPTREGAGVNLFRAFGNNQVPQFDPFLLLDEFHSNDPMDYLPGFPWHPHRGIETITYLLQGRVEHRDSLGNGGTINPGEVQWMTAGSGIIHQEMPQNTGSGAMRGFQIWLNLPADCKMMPPRYRALAPSELPVAELASGAKAKVICGALEGVQGPVREIVTDPEFFDVYLPAGCVFVHGIKPGCTALAYVLDGRAYFDDQREKEDSDQAAEQALGTHTEGCPCELENVILYTHQGDQIIVTMLKESVRFLLLSGNPLREPVAWRGPVVMNTDEE